MQKYLRTEHVYPCKNVKFIIKCYKSGAKWCQSYVKWFKREEVFLMFTGSYEHTVDAKGRLIVPSKFREELGEKFIITFGLDGCLYMYPMNKWEDFVTQLSALPGGRQSRELQRYFLASAVESEIDKQGRTLIPSVLREKTGIKKNIMVVGMMGKIELWDKELWDKNNSEFGDINEIAEQLAEHNLNFM